MNLYCLPEKEYVLTTTYRGKNLILTTPPPKLDPNGPWSFIGIKFNFRITMIQ